MVTAGADDYATNISGNNYIPNVQIVTGMCKLYALTVTALVGAGTDVFVWVFDLAAGATTSKAPVATLHVVKGTTGQLTFAEGAFFKNGIYILVNNADPADANTAGTQMANNTAYVRVDFRRP